VKFGCPPLSYLLQFAELDLIFLAKDFLGHVHKLLQGIDFFSQLLLPILGNAEGLLFSFLFPASMLLTILNFLEINCGHFLSDLRLFG